MDMKHVDVGESGEKEKRKRGRKLEKNPQKYRYMVRLNEAENKRFYPYMGNRE
ncbi:hypothetical protein EZS27_014983 [termite gut metagenome]|uniref:Uncharacterized protein n=1 Tax=termite gut metagenome TaxID=433724 RepID=A0A5J4RTZ5_9ZZZZ